MQCLASARQQGQGKHGREGKKGSSGKESGRRKSPPHPSGGDGLVSV
jgi:hypothetical protein